MSVLRRAFERRAIASSALPDMGVPGTGWWSGGMRWQPGTGVTVATPTGATRVAAVFACWRLLADAISTLPLDVYRRKPDGSRTEADLPSYLRFAIDLTRVEYLTQVVLSLLADGNAFIATPRGRDGVPSGLVPLDPARVSVIREKSRVLYEIGGKQFGSLDVLHIRALTLPGELRGLSPLAAARDVIDGAAAAQSYGTEFFRNAGVPPIALEVPGDVHDEQSARAKARKVAAAWDETHQGPANAGKTGVLLGGAKLTTVALNAKDQQWLESRQFSVQEIARIYGVPPHLIADSSNSTSWGSGLAEQNLAFGQFSLRPWITRIEEAHDRLLASHGSRAYMRLNLDALLRASLSDRYESYAVGITSGFLGRNEARAFEDLPPLPEPEPAPVPVPDPAPGGGDL